VRAFTVASKVAGMAKFSVSARRVIIENRRDDAVETRGAVGSERQMP
jgi:hypothetical protein